MLYTSHDIRKLIIPVMIEQFLTFSVGLVDTIMISVVGEAALSSVSLVDTLNILVIDILYAFAVGGGIIVGHYLGEKNKFKASETGWELIALLLILSLLITTIFMAFNGMILASIFGSVEAEVMNGARTYLFITAISIVPLSVYDGCSSLFRVMNRTKVTMWISLLINIINVIGNAICIYGLKMGIAGAAIPTTVARFIGALIIVALLFNAKNEINLRAIRSFRFHRIDLKKILHVSIPNSIENSVFQVGKILLAMLVSTLGTASIAANSVGSTIANFNTLPGRAANVALLSIASVCIGAKEFDQTKYYTKKLLKISRVGIAIISTILFLGAPFILKLYNLGETSEILVMQIIRLHAVMAVVLWPYAFTLPYTLRAAKDSIWPTGVSLISMWLFRIGLASAFIFVFDFGILSVWYAMAVDWLFRSICYAYRYKSDIWKIKYLDNAKETSGS